VQNLINEVVANLKHERESGTKKIKRTFKRRKISEVDQRMPSLDQCQKEEIKSDQLIDDAKITENKIPPTIVAVPYPKAVPKCNHATNDEYFKSFLGKHLGDYKISELIGSGTMGTVYYAKDINLGRDVAVKILNQSISRDKMFINQFQNEARAASIIHHPNIAQIFYLGNQADLYYFAMEYIDGWSLEDILQEMEVMSGLRALDLYLLHNRLSP